MVKLVAEVALPAASVAVIVYVLLPAVTVPSAVSEALLYAYVVPATVHEEEHAVSGTAVWPAVSVLTLAVTVSTPLPASLAFAYT